MFCLSIHLLINIWVVSTFWLLWIMLLWTWVYKYLFKTLLSILLGIYPEVELLDHMVIPFLNFWGNNIMFSIAVAPFYNLTNSSQGFQFLYSLTNTYVDSGHPNGCQMVPHCVFFLNWNIIYNVVLVSGVQQSDSVTHTYIFFFIFFSIIVYYKIWNIVPYAIQ